MVSVVDSTDTALEPWQVPSFYGRALAPASYRKPTSCSLSDAVAIETMLSVGQASSNRTARGGTEVTLGAAMHGPTPFDFVHPGIAQPMDVRLPQVFTRVVSVVSPYENNSSVYVHSA